MMTFCFNHCLNEVECEENINLILKTLLVAHSRLGVSTQYLFMCEKHLCTFFGGADRNRTSSH